MVKIDSDRLYELLPAPNDGYATMEDILIKYGRPRGLSAGSIYDVVRGVLDRLVEGGFVEKNSDVKRPNLCMPSRDDLATKFIAFRRTAKERKP